MQVSSFASAASALPVPNPNTQAKAGPERPAMQPLLGTAPVHTLPYSPCCHFNVLTLGSTCKGSPSARLEGFYVPTVYGQTEETRQQGEGLWLGLGL